MKLAHRPVVEEWKLTMTNNHNNSEKTLPPAPPVQCPENDSFSENPAAENRIFRGRKCRRRLFSGQSDEVEDEIAVQRIVNSLREECKTKWNFDFETETPLEGDWKWEKV
ncbi:unnamed protein product [Phyllotreta striolata]|uniref:Cyclin-dependent kinase inhibitor domain-containing protein n=1 Tax=Phyllotreta striolata TaxID=444603 RepID=A0A9N9TU34_PHYSR|nr:unnamed protein product [Phyllotreta striolata]